MRATASPPVSSTSPLRTSPSWSRSGRGVHAWRTIVLGPVSRRRFERPADEWVRQHDEGLRIVPEVLWERVQAIAGERGKAYRRTPDGRRFAGTLPAAGHRVRGKHLFSGLLRCGECGGAFYGVKRTDRLCCGWRVDRGPKVCASVLVVPRDDLEVRVIGAVRDRILTPENVRRAIDLALAMVRRELGRDDGEADQRRLAEIEEEIERVARLAARVGNVDAVARVIADLEAERKVIAERRRLAPIEIDDAQLRRRAERWASDARATLAGSPKECRSGFEALLGGRRMSVLADPEQRFRVEGIFDVPWMNEGPSESFDNRGAISGSGGGI